MITQENLKLELGSDAQEVISTDKVYDELVWEIS